MIREEYIQRLMNDIYLSDSLNVYDHAAQLFDISSEDFADIKSRADQLVRDRLAFYTDREHTTLTLTNFGRYWILKGGYEIFLREGQCTKEKTREKSLAAEKERLIEARLKLTQYRLAGFWLALVISSVGFILSLFNLYLIMKGK